MNETTAGDNSMVVPLYCLIWALKKIIQPRLGFHSFTATFIFFIYQYLIVQLTLLWRRSLGTFVLKDLIISLIFQ